jgi:hypothetical protein
VHTPSAEIRLVSENASGQPLSGRNCRWLVGKRERHDEVDPFSAAFCLDDLTYGNLEPCGRSQYLLCVQQ